jgi:hypothetical protein
VPGARRSGGEQPERGRAAGRRAGVGERRRRRPGGRPLRLVVPGGPGIRPGGAAAVAGNRCRVGAHGPRARERRGAVRCGARAYPHRCAGRTGEQRKANGEQPDRGPAGCRRPAGPTCGRGPGGGAAGLRSARRRQRAPRAYGTRPEARARWPARTHPAEARTAPARTHRARGGTGLRGAAVPAGVGASGRRAPSPPIRVPYAAESEEHTRRTSGLRGTAPAPRTAVQGKPGVPAATKSRAARGAGPPAPRRSGRSHQLHTPHGYLTERRTAG